jgi:hypothetical protein
MAPKPNIDPETFARQTWSLSEVAAILDGKDRVVSHRNLQAFVSGQTLRLIPERRGRYGLWDMVRFCVAARFLERGMPSTGTQAFLDNVTKDGFFDGLSLPEKMSAMIVARVDETDKCHLSISLFTDEEKAVKVMLGLIESNVRFASVNFDRTVQEVIGRILAWNARTEYVSPQTAAMKKAFHDLRVKELSSLSLASSE